LSNRYSFEADALPRPERADWADIIDFLTMHPDARRYVTGILGELEAME